MSRSQSNSFRSIIIIYFFFFLNEFVSPTQSLCRHDQRDALLELKKELQINQTNEEISITTNSWNKSVDCCSWWGVTCDTKLGEVISLKLNSYSPTNTSLKSSSCLLKLYHLRQLDLSSCNLHGEIPSLIGNLSRLTDLDLSSNHLVGEVPTSIGNLNQLRYLSLYNNDLIGNLPTSFTNLTKLSDLNLYLNQFTGGAMVLANLTSLSNLDLSLNHFKSSLSVDLSGLHKLDRFIVRYNSFSGPFPSSLLMISSLGLIDLSGNQFEGPIDFGNTSSSSTLAILDVSENNFRGLIPNSISKLRNLYSLDLSYNNFGGQVPTSMSKLVNLDSLDFSYNNLEGQVPQFLWRLSKLSTAELSHNSLSSFGKSVEVVHGASLRVLNLGSNSLQEPFPQWICKLKDLVTLDFSNNSLTGSIPQCLKNSTSLRELNLRNNSLSGTLPDLCGNMTELHSLDVSHNNLVGMLSKSLIHCNYIVLLIVNGNKINDTFPFWLGSLQGLMVLILRSNAFYGPVYNPSTYLGFQRMRIIDISDNNFVGSLPQNYFANWTEMSRVWSNEDIPETDFMGDDINNTYEDSMDLVYKGVDTYFARIFKALKVVDFSGNKLYGHIPETIGLLNELRVLNLSRNTFTGNIPPSLGNITKLEILDLSQNNLSGEIPRVFGSFSFLSYINLSHNHLQGLVPRSTQFGSQACSSFVGNLGLYGLEKICGEVNVPVNTLHLQPKESLSEAKEPMLNWIAAAIAFRPGVFCGLVIGHIFMSHKQKWLMSKFRRKTIISPH